jgi:hypothetical protein
MPFESKSESSSSAPSLSPSILGCCASEDAKLWLLPLFLCLVLAEMEGPSWITFYGRITCNGT